VWIVERLQTSFWNFWPVSNLTAYPDSAAASIPYLVFVVFTSLIAALPCRSQPSRFTFRDLLVAITLAELLLA
jgi:hypothetical protein